MRTNTIRLRLTVVFVSMGIVAASLLLTAQAPVLVASYTATTSNVSGAGDAIRVQLLKWSTDADRDQLLNAWLHPAPAAPPVVAQAAPPAAAGGGGRGGRGAAGAAAPPPQDPPAPVANGDAPPAAAAAPRGAGGGRGGGGRGGNPAAAGAAPAAAADGAAAPPLPAAAGGRGGRGGGAAPAAPVEVPPETPESSLAAALQKTVSVGILWTSESAGYSIKYAYRIPSPDGGERVIFATDRRLGNWSDQWWKPTGPAVATNLPFTIFEFRLNGKVDGEGRTTLTGKVVEDTTAKSIAVGNYSEQPIVFKAVKKVR